MNYQYPRTMTLNVLSNKVIWQDGLGFTHSFNLTSGVYIKDDGTSQITQTGQITSTTGKTVVNISNFIQFERTKDFIKIFTGDLYGGFNMTNANTYLS